MSSIRSVAKTTICRALKYSGLLEFHERRFQHVGQTRMSILLFHRVTDEIPEDGLTVSIKKFQDICGLLRDSFRVVNLAEIDRIVRQGDVIPPRTVAITFDDSYYDNLGAARILSDHGLSACFFIPPAMIGTNHVYDWDRHLPPLRHLGWDDVREMARLGMEFGSHTLTHPNVATLSDEELRHELSTSKNLIEQQTGLQVRWFAYPFGGQNDFRREQLALMHEAGYERCFSAFGGHVDRNWQDPILPRQAVPCFANPHQLEVHLSGCWDWFDIMR